LSNWHDILGNCNYDDVVKLESVVDGMKITGSTVKPADCNVCRVPTGQGKLEKVREFEWSGKVRENAKVTGKSGKFGGKLYLFVQLL